MKKKGLILLFAMLACVCTGCGEKRTNDELSVDLVTQEDLVMSEDISTERETAEPTTRIVESTEEKTEAVTSETAGDTQGSGVTAISPEDATAMLMVTLGERDEQTGNEYSYSYVENVQIDGVTYLVFDWRWLVDDHMSKLADLFVTADGSKIYEGWYNGPEDSEVYLDSPLN